jgi:hypothetical protein
MKLPGILGQNREIKESLTFFLVSDNCRLGSIVSRAAETNGMMLKNDPSDWKAFRR